MPLPSAYAAALLTVLNAKRYSDEKEKKVSRFRVSRQTLGKLAKRQLLRSAFLDEYEEHLRSLGWMMIELPDASYAFLETASVEGWTKISPTRVSKEITKISKGTMLEEELENEVGAHDDSDDELED